jgi:TonB family protein
MKIDISYRALRKPLIRLCGDCKVRNQLRLIFSCAVIMLFAVSSAVARTHDAASPRSGQPAYPNSESGLKHLVQDMLAAAKAHDQSKLTELADSMMLPAPEDWFLKTFGPDSGRVYAKLYAENSGHAVANLVAIFSELAAQKFSIREVTLFKEVCDFSASSDEFPMLAARVVPEQFSLVRFANDQTSRTLRFMAYVGGGFRFLGLLRVKADQYSEIEKTSKSKPGDASISELVAVPSDIQMAKVIHRVEPVYPDFARATRAEGNVILHAIIGKDGSVGNLRVMRGQCPFVKAAVIAVKQWRFNPTLKNGIPVDTASIFELHFAMPF